MRKGSKQGTLVMSPDCPRFPSQRPQFPLLQSSGEYQKTSKIPSKLEIQLCFLSPASCSKIWNTLRDGSRCLVLGDVPG